MKVIKPTPSQAAFVLKKFLEENAVTMKLSQTQEAVARMLGFKDWNALAADMDPRVGMPEGCLQQDGKFQYTLLGESQTSVMLAVKNIRVSVKHDDEGVVVDVFSEKGLCDGEESLGSTWVTFAEAEGDDEDDVSQLDPEVDELLQRMLVAKEISLLDVRFEADIPLLFKDALTIRKAMTAEEFEPATEVIKFKAMDGSVHGITIGAMLKSNQDSADSWRLPSGTRMSVPTTEESADTEEAGWFDIKSYSTRESWATTGPDGGLEELGFKSLKEAIAAACAARYDGAYQVTVTAYGQHKDYEAGEGVYTRFKRED